MCKKGKDIRNCKYGLFVHYVLSQASYADGTAPKNISEAAERFDAQAFADSVAKMGVEYLILTAWHYRVQPLYPSAVTEKWRPGNSPSRDLLGDILTEMEKREIPVLLYTHPRDGHDFPEEEQKNTGWGLGTDAKDSQHPNESAFDYARWNAYMLELYEELAQRYASRIVGFYTDGNGPKDPASLLHTDQDFQIVNYLKIRDIMKSYNPDLISFQNYYGEAYGNDFGNSETYTVYMERVLGKDRVDAWQCAGNVATSITPFTSGWVSGAKREEHTLVFSADAILRYILFNASVTRCGGTVLATGPFVEGGVWPMDALETLGNFGKELSRFPDSLMQAKPSLSYPTLSGVTLPEIDYRFWMTGQEESYEYLHCLQIPEDGVISWGLPEDGICLEAPVVLTGEMSVSSFTKTEDGYCLRLAGRPDALDTVIRFVRAGRSTPPIYEWINNSDRRICYQKDWEYIAAWIYDKEHRAVGSIERDAHISHSAGSSVYFAFYGDVIELYGVRAEGNGAADVYIDGVFCGTIDQQAEERTPRALCFRSISLHGGQHVLQLYVKDERPFLLDAFRVIQ